MPKAQAGGGFEWWAPHDRARRSAQLLLAGVATICAAYVAVVVGAIAVGIAIARIDAQPGHETWQHRFGVLRLAVLAIVFVAALAALIDFAAVASLASRSMRVARARALTDGEAEHAEECVESFALAVGIPTPAVYVVDDPAPNGFAAGHHGVCGVCLTTGALELAPDQVSALCAQTIASIANRALPLTCAAADLVAVARWCTKAIWATMGVLLVSTLVGVPVPFVAGATIAITLLVLGTMPLLAVADRAIPRLQERAALLADLDAVRLTNEPAPLAWLLLALAEDSRTVATPWQIARLWFDPDTTRPKRGTLQRGFESWIENSSEIEAGDARRNAERARHMLVERARVLVDQTSGDVELRAQLDRTAAARPRH